MSNPRYYCCKCGRKRLSKFLTTAVLHPYRSQYTKDWFVFPNKASRKCIMPCIPYTRDVRLTAVKK